MMRRMFLDRVCGTLGLHKHGQCCGQRPASAPKKARLHMCCMPDTRRMRELMRKPTGLLTYTKTNEISRGGLVAPNTGNHMESTRPPLEILCFFCITPGRRIIATVRRIYGYAQSRYCCETCGFSGDDASGSPVSQNSLILGRPGVPENMILGSPVIHKR